MEKSENPLRKLVDENPKTAKIMMVILWLVLITLGIYSIMNIHALSTDPCQVCMDMGAHCNFVDWGAFGP